MTTKKTSTKKASVSTKKRSVKSRVRTHKVNMIHLNADGSDGKKELLTVKTACNTFGKCITNKEHNLVGKCKKCVSDNPEVVQACLVQTNPKIAFAKAGGGGRKSEGYVFPAEGTQAFKIDSMLKKGILDAAIIATETGLKRARIARRIKAIKDRANCPYFSAETA